MSAGLSVGGLVAEGRMPLVVGCCSLALGRLNSGLWVISRQRNVYVHEGEDGNGAVATATC